MELFDLKVPYHHYLQQAFDALRVQILLNGYPHLEAWRFTTEGDPYWRLYWNKQDGASVRHHGERMSFGPDSILLIPPSTGFTADLRNPVDHFYLHFALENPYTASTSRIWRLPANSTRRSQIGRITVMGIRGQLAHQAGQILAHGLIVDVLGDLPASVWSEKQLDSRIRNALTLIDRQESGAGLDNSILAEAAHMSRAGFVRLFSQQVGVSPMKYALDRRLSRAGILLSHTDQSIDQVAEECGFCDRAHFSKQFKRRFGMGPAHYRRRDLAGRGGTGPRGLP